MKKNFVCASHIAAVLLFVGTVCAAQVGPENTAAGVGPDATSKQPASVPVSEPKLQQRDPRYKLVAGDTFDITFELSPEFNQTAVAVQPDGFVTLRGVGDLKVEGQSVPQLHDTLVTAYGKILHDPIVSVVLKDFQKPFFVADGQLGHPGKYEMHGPVTLTEGIAIAGGFLSSAKHSQVLLFRRVNDEWMSAQIINVKKMQSSGNLREDPFLHPGDMLFVPKNRLSKVDRYIPYSNVGMSAYSTQY